MPNRDCWLYNLPYQCIFSGEDDTLITLPANSSADHHHFATLHTSETITDELCWKICTSCHATVILRPKRGMILCLWLKKTITCLQFEFIFCLFHKWFWTQTIELVGTFQVYIYILSLSAAIVVLWILPFHNWHIKTSSQSSCLFSPSCDCQIALDPGPATNMRYFKIIHCLTSL